MAAALDIQVKGIVQGVGFRPFVYRLACEHGARGWVLNATDGVFIHVEGESAQLDDFVRQLSARPPAAAQVEEVLVQEAPVEGFDSFEIRFSDAGAVERTTLVSPDLAICKDCERELFDPADRRYRYPFINCTNCGPRFTIIERLPYDRKNTSMKDFPMCGRCASEYADPADRRFHAQPDACFECGPHVSWRERRDVEDGLRADAPDALRPCAGIAAFGEVSWGRTREQSDAIFARAAQLLCEGAILAVKGLGGFHLVCDANNERAIARLRARKRREGKAFAVMMRNAGAARRVCEAGQLELETLNSVQRPIVLLRKRPDARLARGLADKLPELGVMLPYTPVQMLLMHDFEEAWRAAGLDGVVCSGGVCDTSNARTPMLVMTSGNIHDEPIVTDDAEAYEKLADVADAFLGNDRAIRARYDDSVVRVVRVGEGEAVQVVRRARGLAPRPLAIEGEAQDAAGAVPAPEASVFAAGPEQKNTFTITRGGEAFVSQHVGDMENAETYDAWLDAKARFEQLFELQPTLLACDRHPEYLSTKWARQAAREQGLPLVELQHHHAHIASVLGERGIEGPVCGIAFDGTGYGMDGTIWGGEVLLATQGDFERFAAFRCAPMPGGAAAVKHPLRMAYGELWACGLLEHPGAAPALKALGPQAQICGQMIEKGINSPLTSSVGRIFDAASALLGICPEPSYEGEPAILLEAAITQPDAAPAGEAAAAPDPASAGQPAAPAAADAAATRYRIGIARNPDAPASPSREVPAWLLDPAPLFRAMLDDKAAGAPASLIARRFHEAFVRLIVDVARLVRDERGIDQVALSGGVFMNRHLIEHACADLQKEGFSVVLNRDLPPNDGCVSFGQAVIACARQRKQSGE